MDRKDAAMSMVGTLVQDSENSSVIAQQITKIFNENSLSEMQENLEKLKALMSCYQCALLEVETKFRVLNERFSLRHERNSIETIKPPSKSLESIHKKL